MNPKAQELADKLAEQEYGTYYAALYIEQQKNILIMLINQLTND
jgi:hypothetical protein